MTDSASTADSKQQPIWAEISLPRLVANMRQLQQQLAGADLLGVVKADAYGHGAIPCAIALVQAGAQWLGVTSAEEGATVRAALQAQHLTARILLMRCILAEDAEPALASNLTPAIAEPAHFEALESAATKLGLKNIPIHIELDTGMSRQGVSPQQLPALLARFTATSPLKLEGVMTHFASAEEVTAPQNLDQIEQLAVALAHIRAAGLPLQWLHAGSTATIDADVALPALRKLAAAAGARLMCRPGIGLYGYAMELTGGAAHVRPALQPVLAWKTRILALREVGPGARVGYNGTFIAPGPTRLALLAVGYADGLRRSLSNTGDVLIAGKRARIVGRVSMDVCSVDVTHIPEATVGDEAIILGEQGTEKITADDHARIDGTISYDILCAIAKRVPRLY
ncbi:MAG TPA: alanine racemase [Acidobacteriaceae bacterium]